jgi:hypothetical protein
MSAPAPGIHSLELELYIFVVVSANFVTVSGLQPRMPDSIARIAGARVRSRASRARSGFSPAGSEIAGRLQDEGRQFRRRQTLQLQDVITGPCSVRPQQ